MFDEEESRPVKSVTVPAILDAMSVSDLDKYRSLLEEEIMRIETEKQRKLAHRTQADSFFKS